MARSRLTEHIGVYAAKRCSDTLISLLGVCKSYVRGRCPPIATPGMLPVTCMPIDTRPRRTPSLLDLISPLHEYQRVLIGQRGCVQTFVRMIDILKVQTIQNSS